MATLVQTITREYSALQKKIHALQVGLETFGSELVKPHKTKRARRPRKRASAARLKSRVSKPKATKKNKSSR